MLHDKHALKFHKIELSTSVTSNTDEERGNQKASSSSNEIGLRDSKGKTNDSATEGNATT